MNTAKYVDEQIPLLKGSGIPLSDAAWQAAQLCLGWPYIYGDRGQECTPSRRRSVHNAHPDQEGLVTKCQVLSGKKGSCGGCQWFPDGERVRSFDCRGFTYWVLLQIYGWELKGAGCTTQWNNEANWKAKGSIDSIPEDTLVCLFYRSKTQPNVMQHTGFGYKGQTIECGNGVTFSKARAKKWEYWAIPACVEGDVPDPDPEKKPTLRRGDKGPYVRLLQTDLQGLGYDLGRCGVDGDFGAATEKAVKAFQKDHGLKADGIVGQATWTAIDAAVDPEPTPAEDLYTVTIPHATKAQAEELCREWTGATMEKE